MALVYSLICALVLSLTPSRHVIAGEAIFSPRTLKAAHIGYANVLYWPNKNCGLGHIALEVFFPRNNNSERDIYLSWARENDKNYDLSFHNQEPKVVTLPIASVNRFLPFIQWELNSEYSSDFNKNYGTTYRTLTNNCAHAVLKGLKKLGFSTKVKSHRLALTPKQVYHLAKKLAQQEQHNVRIASTGVQSSSIH